MLLVTHEQFFDHQPGRGHPERPERLGAVLDGINAAAVGLMAGVSVQLVGDAIIDPLTVAVAVGAGLLLWRTQLNSAWLITGGAAIGLVNTWLSG